MGREERIIDDVTRAFDNHIAQYWKFGGDGAPVVEMIRFKQPGTINYFIEFIITNGTLMVRGDLGEAVYCWYSDIGFDFLAGVNMEYMASKCQASEVGRRFVEWDGDEGRSSLEHYMECRQDEDEIESFMKESGFELDDGGEYSEAQYKYACSLLTKKRCMDILSECDIYSEFYWAADINRLDDPGELFKDGDYWEWAYRVGEVPHVRLYCHFIGMKLAIKQIQTQRMMADLKEMNRC